MKRVKVLPTFFTREALIAFAKFLKEIKMVESTNEGIRMIEQGAVSVYVKE